MGLIQQIEGIFGFGKKANQTTQNEAAIAAAINSAQNKLAAGQAFIEALKPFAAENPIFAAAITGEEALEAETQTVLTWLKSLVPAQPAPAAPGLVPKS